MDEIDEEFYEVVEHKQKVSVLLFIHCHNCFPTGFVVFIIRLHHRCNIFSHILFVYIID